MISARVMSEIGIDKRLNGQNLIDKFPSETSVSKRKENITPNIEAIKIAQTAKTIPSDTVNSKILGAVKKITTELRIPNHNTEYKIRGERDFFSKNIYILLSRQFGNFSAPGQIETPLSREARLQPIGDRRGRKLTPCGPPVRSTASDISPYPGFAVKPGRLWRAGSKVADPGGPG